MSTAAIFFTVEFNIHPGKFDEFTALAKECVDSVRTNEPEVLSYEWFLDETKIACFVNEIHTSSESMLAHLAHVGPLLDKILQVARLARLDVFGNPSAEATAALGKLGAIINPHLLGFTR